MEQQYFPARQKLIEAVSLLATGPEDIRGRLPKVYPVLVGLSIDDLPEVLQKDFEWVMGKLSAKEPRYLEETKAEASVAAMRSATAAKIARKVVDLSERLRTIMASD